MSEDHVMEPVVTTPLLTIIPPSKVAVDLEPEQVSALAQLINQRIEDLRDAKQEGTFEPEVVGLWLPIVRILERAHAGATYRHFDVAKPGGDVSIFRIPNNGDEPPPPSDLRCVVPGKGKLPRADEYRAKFLSGCDEHDERLALVSAIEAVPIGPLMDAYHGITGNPTHTGVREELKHAAYFGEDYKQVRAIVYTAKAIDYERGQVSAKAHADMVAEALKRANAEHHHAAAVSDVVGTDGERDLREHLNAFVTKDLVAAYEHEASGDLPHTIYFDRDTWTQKEVIDAIMSLGIDRARRCRESAQAMHDKWKADREAKQDATAAMFENLSNESIRTALAHHIGTDHEELSEGDVFAFDRTELIEHLTWECSDDERAAVKDHAEAEHRRADHLRRVEETNRHDRERAEQIRRDNRARAEAVPGAHLYRAFNDRMGLGVTEPSTLIDDLLNLEPDLMEAVLKDAEANAAAEAAQASVRASAPGQPPSGPQAAHGPTSPDPEPETEEAVLARVSRVPFMYLSDAYADAAPGRVPEMSPRDLIGAVMVLQPDVRRRVLTDAEARQAAFEKKPPRADEEGPTRKPPKGTPFEVEVTDVVRVIVAHHEGNLAAVGAELMLPEWMCDAIMGKYGANVRTLRALGDSPSPANYQAAKAQILDRLKGKCQGNKSRLELAAL